MAPDQPAAAADASQNSSAQGLSIGSSTSDAHKQCRVFSLKIINSLFPISFPYLADFIFPVSCTVSLFDLKPRTQQVTVVYRFLSSVPSRFPVRISTSPQDTLQVPVIRGLHINPRPHQLYSGREIHLEGAASPHVRFILPIMLPPSPCPSTPLASPQS